MSSASSPVPSIPDGVTLYSELPTKDGPSLPTLYVIYQDDDILCKVVGNFPQCELDYRSYMDVLILRQAVRTLSENLNITDLIDLHRDVCLWIPN